MKCAGVCSNLPTSRSEGSMNHCPKLPFIFHPRLLLRHLRHQLCKARRSGLYQRPNRWPSLWNERPVSSFLHPRLQWELVCRSCVLWLHPPRKPHCMAHLLSPIRLVERFPQTSCQVCLLSVPVPFFVLISFVVVTRDKPVVVQPTKEVKAQSYSPFQYSESPLQYHGLTHSPCKRLSCLR